ncbi:hypothetical protein RHAB15C_0000266 [Candidatus Rhabdochlamydia porcellionis]|uniref:Uncharacterized protein n=1 Tax=Candidatus Rhabdochlamydia porcellionis TaxID=225148 RepID=A0ABX8YZ98_9BACT|nr:hypothetical protein RHAB15C_0000266 [Candidatus Rhabdochlamydia porcellionis]
MMKKTVVLSALRVRFLENISLLKKRFNLTLVIVVVLKSVNIYSSNLLLGNAESFCSI